MDIEKIALNYLQDTVDTAINVVKTARKVVRKRNKKALVAMYDRIVKKYSKERALVESIKIQGANLKIEYDNHKKEMDKHYNVMIDLRQKINKMDDDGVDYIENVEEVNDDEPNESTTTNPYNYY